MRKSLILIIFNLLSLGAFCQMELISVHLGCGTYDLSSIKEYQQQMIGAYAPLPIVSVNKFPNYLNYSLSFEKDISNNILLGLDIAHYTTGGRNHLKDYSGEYKLDMLLNAYRFGVSFRRIYPSSKSTFYYHIKTGIVLSNYKMVETINVFHVDSVTHKDANGSNNFFLEPGIGFSYDLGQNLSLDSNIGYQMDINSGFITKYNSYIYWSGFRLQVGITYNLSTIFKQ